MLEGHLRALAEAGMHPVTSTQLVDHLEFGTPLPDKPVMISFDDAYGGDNQLAQAQAGVLLEGAFETDSHCGIHRHPDSVRRRVLRRGRPDPGQRGAGDDMLADRITRADLIVVDDIGMLPAGQAAAEALYRLVDAAYERRSVAVTSNLHPAGFDTIMPKTLATATVDRLLHHAHIVLTEGTSLRLAEATAGKGVIPLT
jgi:hypothetical protein